MGPTRSPSRPIGRTGPNSISLLAPLPCRIQTAKHGVVPAIGIEAVVLAGQLAQGELHGVALRIDRPFLRLPEDSLGGGQHPRPHHVLAALTSRPNPVSRHLL